MTDSTTPPPSSSDTTSNLHTQTTPSAAASKSLHHSTTPTSPPKTPTPTQPATPTPTLKRQQLDLLILTSFPDNSTLHWRPTWFTQAPFSLSPWTLHNPPNVVTERLPHTTHGRHVYTRRMRRAGDAPPAYVKTRAHWRRVCALYGVPENFLCEEQVRLMRAGLARDGDGGLMPPPAFPLYPEPQPLGAGCYVLSPKMYASLPGKFCCVDAGGRRGEVVVVRSSGALSVALYEDYRLHAGLRVSCEKSGKCRGADLCAGEFTVPMMQGTSRRWSYIPWTDEMEKSCQPWRLAVRLWNEVVDGAGIGAKPTADVEVEALV